MPIVVAAGLAAGVFAGLFVGVGPKKAPAVGSVSLATGSGSNTGHGTDAGEPKPSAIAVAAPTPTPSSAAVPSGSGVGSAINAPGIGSGSASGSAPAEGSAGRAGADAGNAAPSQAPAGAAGSAAAAVPAKKLAKVTFAVKPAGAIAEIRVDGQVAVDGVAEIDITDGDKKVMVTAVAEGFSDFEKQFLITRDDTHALSLVPKKSVKAPSSRPGRPSSGTGSKPKPKKGGGLIDI